MPALAIQKLSAVPPSAKPKRKQAIQHSICDQVPSAPAGHFGCGPVADVSCMYQKLALGNSSTGSVTNNRELGLKLTDFFDYNSYDSTAGGVAQFVSNYFWDVNQNLFSNGSDPSGGGDYLRTFCRVRKVEVWVMPTCRTWGAGTEPDAGVNNARSMITVNCQVPGTTQQSSAVSLLGTGAFATNTQVTNVLPQIDTKWKKVLTADLQKTFQSGVVRPVFALSDATNQCLFQMSIVNPLDGTPYMQGEDAPPVRVKVCLTIDQPVSTVQNAQLAVFRNEEFSTPSTEQNGAAYPGTSSHYVQMNIGGARNFFR